MKKLSWQEVFDMTDLLGKRINDSGFESEMLVALARGGWIPTRLLSDRLKVKKMASIGISYQDQERTILSTYSLPSPIKPGQKILLIEDRLESAKSMKKAFEILTTQGAIVKTACYFTMSKSILIPDFSLELTDDNVIFPWE